MARKHPNPLDNPPAATSSEEQDEVEETEEDDDDQHYAQRDGSETEEGIEDGEEEEDDDDNDGDGDGDGDDDDEDEEEAEPKKEKGHPQPSQPKPVSKIPNPPQDEDEDDSETESDSDPKSPGVSGFTIRPHITKPAVATPSTAASVKPKKAAAKPAALEKENATPMVVSLKRPIEGDESKSKVKKAKAENGGGGGEEEAVVSEKKGAITRLWNEGDEIAVLKGMIEFHDKNGVDPNSDSIAFHEFVKKNLSVDVSKTQLMDKVRRLKKKYKNNVGKGDKGQDPVFSRPHEHKAFELSKKIWGGLGVENKKSSKKKNLVDENAKPNKESTINNGNAGFVMALPKDEQLVAVNNKQEESKDHQEGTFAQLYPFLNLSLKTSNFASALISKDGAEAMEGCLRCMEKSKLEELEEEWKKQILAEAEVCVGRSALLQKQVRLVSDWRAQRG